jgi:outer membrane murein-binding lipoprotein Lpp
MRKIIVAGAIAGTAVFTAGCGNSTKVHSLQTKVRSLQSELALDQRQISVLRRDLAKERDKLFVTVQAAQEENASRLAAVKRLTLRSHSHH